MMAGRKTTKKYYFSVEGETEDWYLGWLEGQINACAESAYAVKFIRKVQKDPCKMVKSLTLTGKTTIWHFSDYESNDDYHIQQFQETMDRLKKAQKLGKQVEYSFGYSNFSFDLWIVLHKCDCKSPLAHRRQYLSYINRAYGEEFEDMGKYKHEGNFKRCLSKLNIDCVKDAIRRSEAIMNDHQINGDTLRQYKGYEYYTENPSLDVWIAIKSIMRDCKLI